MWKKLRFYFSMKHDFKVKDSQNKEKTARLAYFIYMRENLKELRFKKIS